MKIERVTAYHLRPELGPAGAFAYSQARVGARTAMLVEIATDDGRSGWGGAYGPPAPSKTIERLAAEPIRRAGDMIEVPQRPGLGLGVDRAPIARPGSSNPPHPIPLPGGERESSGGASGERER